VPDWIEISVRTSMSVVILFIITKMLGKRQVSQLSLFEYITGISIGNIIGYISLDLDNKWYHGIIALIVWTSISIGVELITLKSKKVRDFVDGKETILAENGQILREKLKKERLTTEEFLEQLRKKNVYRVADVEFAVMEASGEISVMLKKDYQPLSADKLGWRLGKNKPSATIIIDGNLQPTVLEAAGYSRDWLMHELKRRKLGIEDVFLGQIDDEGQLLLYSGNEIDYGLDAGNKPEDELLQLTAQFESQLRRLERLSRNEQDRQAYQLALERFQASDFVRIPRKMH